MVIIENICSACDSPLNFGSVLECLLVSKSRMLQVATNFFDIDKIIGVKYKDPAHISVFVGLSGRFNIIENIIYFDNTESPIICKDYDHRVGIAAINFYRAAFDYNHFHEHDPICVTLIGQQLKVIWGDTTTGFDWEYSEVPRYFDETFNLLPRFRDKIAAQGF